MKRGHDRCGSLRSLGTRSASLGQNIAVPQAQPGEAIVATFTLPFSLWWHVQAEAFKPPAVYMWVNRTFAFYRFVPGTASSPHLLVASSTLGYNPEFTPHAVTSLFFTIGGQPSGTGEVEVHFYAMTMSGVS